MEYNCNKTAMQHSLIALVRTALSHAFSDLLGNVSYAVIRSATKK